jgi:hypothetical protein
MAGNVSQIDYEAVAKSADGFETVGTTLAVVNTALEAAMMILRTTAFIGLVGGAAVERYLANIQPKVEKLSQKCKEMSGDLREVIRIRQQTDEANATNFTN